MSRPRPPAAAVACGYWLLASFVVAAVANAMPAVRGTVRDGGGRLLAGASVALLPVLTNYEASRLLLAGQTAPAAVATVRTGAAGRFELAAPAGMYRLEVRAPASVPFQYAPLPLVEDVELPPVRLLGDVGARIEVRYRSDGSAVDGVWVGAATSRRSPIRLLTGQAAASGWRPASRLGRAQGGGLVLPRAEGEWLDLQVYRPWSAVPRRVEAVEGLRLLVEPRVAPRRRVELRGAGDQPLAGVLVAHGAEGWPLGVTGEDGTLELLAAVDQQLTLHLLRASGERLAVELTAGREAERFVLPPSVTVTGRVAATAERLPVAGALVWAAADPGAFVRADETGTYALLAPSEARFWLQAEAPGWLPRKEAVAVADGARPGPLLVLERPVSVRGRTVDEAGDPVAGVAVAAWGDPSLPRRYLRPDRSDGRAMSDEGGEFVLAALSPGSTYRLAADKLGYELAVTETSTRRGAAVEAEPKPIRIVLASAIQAFGQVVGPDSEPIAGAEVRLAPPGQGRGRSAPPRAGGDAPNDPYAATTDRDGHFELTALPPEGVVDVSVRARGFAELVLWEVAVARAARPIDLGRIALSTPGASLAGRVVNTAGDAVAAARIWALGEELPASVRAALELVEGTKPGAESAADGSFVLADLEPGREVHLLAEAEGYLPVALPGVGAPVWSPVEIVLAPAASVSGRVVDRDRHPIAGAAVALRPRGLAPGTVEVTALATEQEQAAESDTDGAFAFDTVAAGSYEIEAVAAGFQPAELDTVDVPAAGEVEDLRLVLERGAVVEGQVRTDEGEPAAGTDVVAGHAAAVADAAGRYRLEGVPPGPRTIEARHPELGQAVREIDVGLELRHLDLILESGQRVGGRVLAVDGAPVAGASITLEGGRRYRRHRTESDELGGFLLQRVPPGRYRVRAEKSGFATLEMPAGLRVSDAPAEDLELVLEPGTTVAGRVLGLSAEELAQTRVIAVAEGGVTARPGKIGREGGYEIRDLGAGPWRLTAALANGRRQVEAWILVEPGTGRLHRDLEFDAGLVLSGTVSHDRRPLSGAQVILTGPAGVRQAMTDYRGAFRLEDLEAGAYRLEASSSKDLIVDSRDLDLESDLEISIDIRTARLSGRVVSAAGKPLADALVVLQRQLESGGEAGILTVGTDPEGGFRFSRIAAGRYLLRIRRDGYGTVRESLEIDADLEDLLWVLDPTLGLDLDVRLASGLRPSHVTAYVMDEDGRAIVAESRPLDAQGRARFATVPAGAWRLLVSAPGAATAEVRIAVPGEALAVVLPDGGPIEVLVPALADSGLAANARLIGPDGRAFIALAGSDLAPRDSWQLVAGRAVVPGLPGGDWVVEVEAADGQRWAGAVQTSGRGVARVRLE